MLDESKDAYRLTQVEGETRSNADRIDKLEDRMLAVEVKEGGREKKANRAITGVIALAVSIASGLVVALLAGGHP